MSYSPLSYYPRGCSCIRSGGDGRIILTFSDGVIPWKCPRANECQHLRNMDDRRTGNDDNVRHHLLPRSDKPTGD